jgi:hypothetical protein
MKTELRVFVLLAALIVIVSIVQAKEESESEINEEFNRYAKKFGKNYNSRKAKSFRITLFKKARDEVLSHNELFANGKETYKKELNALSGMTNAEKANLLGALPP